MLIFRNSKSLKFQLHVHFGLRHSTTKQCGLCDKEFTNAQLLNDHLTECEIFVCNNSGCREMFMNLSEMREHIKEEHAKDAPAHYQFHYWIYNSKDRSESEISKSYQTIYPKDW